MWSKSYNRDGTLPLVAEPGMTKTTIQVDARVREELRRCGTMGETYNDVILRLLSTAPSSGSVGKERRKRAARRTGR
jgi:hypothetical protein